MLIGCLVKNLPAAPLPNEEHGRGASRASTSLLPGCAMASLVGDTSAPPAEPNKKGGKIATIKKKMLDRGAPAQKLSLGPAFEKSLLAQLRECNCGYSATEQEVRRPPAGQVRRSPST